MDSFKYGNAIKQGIPVAIIGRPNAGKSSLLNLLLQEDRAIVSDIAGTTRDTIEEAIHIEGVAYRFIDTAGIRTTTDSIEQIGIEKALQKMASAEVVLYIFDVTQLSADDLASDLNVIREKNPQAQCLVIANKVDLLSDTNALPDWLSSRSDLIIGSTHTSELSMAIQRALKRLNQWQDKGNSIVYNARHFECLKTAHQALLQSKMMIEAQMSSDLLALELKTAATAIGDISGQISNDEVLGYIFGKFCIGK